MALDSKDSDKEKEVKIITTGYIKEYGFASMYDLLNEYDVVILRVGHKDIRLSKVQYS